MVTTDSNTSQVIFDGFTRQSSASGDNIIILERVELIEIVKFIELIEFVQFIQFFLVHISV